MAQHHEPRIMVFRPTWEEFQNFPKYIEYMELKGAHYAGLVKVLYLIKFDLRWYFGGRTIYTTHNCFVNIMFINTVNDFINTFR